MLIGVFKSNQKIVNALAVLLTVLLWVPAFYFEEKSLNVVMTGYAWLDVIIAILLISFQSIYLNFITGEYKLIKDNSHLTSLFYVVLNSSLLWLFGLNVVIIANTFILAAFHQFLRVYNSNSNFSIIFSAGLLIGISSLFYAPLILYLILLWTVLIYTTTPTWRDFVISLLGILVPLTYFISYDFVWLGVENFTVETYFDKIFNVELGNLKLTHNFFSLLLLLTIIFSFVSLFSAIGKSVVKISKMMMVVVLMFVIGALTFLLNQQDFLATFVVVTVPLSIMFAIFFQNIKRKWLAELFFLVFLSSIIVGYFS